MSLIRYAPALDDLNSAIKSFYNAKRKYEITTEKLIDSEAEYTKKELYDNVVEFLKFKTLDHGHKFNTDKELFDYWFKEKIK